MTVRRRTALTAAWTAPIITLAAAAPPAAASGSAPWITRVSPNPVSSKVTTIVTVTGGGFVTNGTQVSVMIADVTYTPTPTVQSSTELTFLMPITNATGEGDIPVTTSGGTGYGLIFFS